VTAHVPTPLVMLTVRVEISIAHGPVVVKVGVLVEFDDACSTKLVPKIALAGAPVKLTVGVIAFATVVVSVTCGAAAKLPSLATFSVSVQAIEPVLAMV
jgi:hypothetical protein